MRESIPIRDEVAGRGVTLTHSLPHRLPGKTAAVPNAQYVLISADSGIMSLVGMASPIPFVDALVSKQWSRHKAGQFAGHLLQVDPFAIASQRMTGSPLLSTQTNALHLLPFVYIMECEDEHYRFTLVFRVEGDSWLGRYLYHLPTTYTVAEMKSDAPLAMHTLQAELEAGSDTLRKMMERDALGEWTHSGIKVDIGSYFLVGANLLGLIPAKLLQYKDDELLEEGPDHVIIRSRGDLKADGNKGALAFGVHYFRKDQLHTFKKQDESE